MRRLILSIFLLVPMLLFGQKAFDGTWRLDPQSGKYIGTERFSLQNGTWRCDSCDPKIEVKADGKDQKVSGSPYFDTVSAAEVDDHTVKITNKKTGKVTGTNTYTASNDAKTLS